MPNPGGGGSGGAPPATASVKPLRRRSSIKRSMETDDFMHLLHGSDPVKVELNRLENEVRDKDRELAQARAENKALRMSERAREKAVEELTEELTKVDKKLKLTESLLESKTLEIKKINDEKKASMAAQFAAEATLRRVHTAQKDDDMMPPIEAIFAPLEAELKLARQEIAKLQDDNRALDRLIKSKEAALMDAERTVQLALAKASMVDDLQNKNQELIRQIDICQEENKILDKMHRQKVAEVDKLGLTVQELEEAVLSGGAAANTVKDYRRKFQEMNDERKTLDRELARTKVSANRVAAVVANEWKDANDKVMPVRQWLDERRFMQGEMQQLRDKLTIAERTARSEALLKERCQLRLKVVEEGLKTQSASGPRRSNAGLRSLSNISSRRQSLGGAENISKVSSNGFLSKKPSQLRSSVSSSTSLLLKHAKGASISFDGGPSSISPSEDLANGAHSSVTKQFNGNDSNEAQRSLKEISEERSSEVLNVDSDDSVSGLLYDMLQREVISLRKACQDKDQSLEDKEDAIEMLAKKVETLTKAKEVEAKKMKREVAAMQKEVVSVRDKEQDNRLKRLGSSKSSTNSSQMLNGRNVQKSGLPRNLQ